MRDIFSLFKPFSGHSKDIQQWAVKNVQTHFGNSPLARFTEKLWAHFHDLCARKRRYFLWSSDVFWRFSAYKVYKKYLGALSRFVCPKTKMFAMKFRCILEVLRLQGLQKNFGRTFKICVSKNEDVCHDMKFRCILEVLRLQGSQKNFGCTFKIYASNNEAIFCEVQSHFGSFPLARFTKKFLAHFQEICVQKRSCLLWSSGAVWTFLLFCLYFLHNSIRDSAKTDAQSSNKFQTWNQCTSSFISDVGVVEELENIQLVQNTTHLLQNAWKNFVFCNNFNKFKHNFTQLASLQILWIIIWKLFKNKAFFTTIIHKSVTYLLLHCQWQWTRFKQGYYDNHSWRN